MTAHTTDVLIVGAGPAGSALACHLASAGLAVTLVDRARFPRPKPCADYLGPETLRRLDALGVLSDLEPDGYPLTGTTIFGPAGARMSGCLADAGHDPFRRAGLSISRTVVDAALLAQARAHGARVLEGTKVTNLVSAGPAVAGAWMRSEDGPFRVLARLTVGADGLRSVVARRAGWHRAGVPRRVAFVAHFEGVRDLGDRVELHVGKRGYVGVNPMGPSHANVAVVVPRRRVADGGASVPAAFERFLAEFPAVATRLTEATRITPIRATGPFASRARRVAGPGLALIGDAAEFFDPFTGEGVYAALRSAELLAPVVRDAFDRSPDGAIDAKALARYAAAHREVFRGKRAVERLIGYAMFTPALFDRALTRLDRRGLAPTMLGVTADFIPARKVLNPAFLAAMIW